MAQIVNPATGNVLSVDYATLKEARRAAHLLADEMGLDLEIHSEEGIELIEAQDDWDRALARF